MASRLTRPRRIVVATLVSAVVLGSFAWLVLLLVEITGAFAALALTCVAVLIWIAPRWLLPLLHPAEPASYVAFVPALWRWALRDDRAVLPQPPGGADEPARRHPAFDDAAEPPRRW
ncbi:hypothetical protein [Cellulomonas composti]|uniref:Uncharacterized protein n=1 Tax=Cellulomonas composti TaxID=266130 RepID=A0A511J6M9_9CELL|nr:hypothetical protein [Cellulomonas composti]GEL93648.1 hypothetical protein CCO02nite_03060 [Cellulomonas composti]